MAQEAAPITTVMPRRPLAGTVWIGLAIVAVLVVVSSLVIQLLVLLAQGVDLTSLGSLSETDLLRLFGIRGAFLSTVVQNLIFVGVPLLHIAVLRREPLATIGFSSRNLLLGLALGVGLGIAALVVNGTLSALFAYALDMQQDQSAQFGALLQPGDLVGQALFVLIAVVIAPVGEEALFRGYLFNAIRQRGGNTRLVLAYALSAGLFSAVHLLNVTQGQLALVVPIFAIGLLFAAAMHLTGSLVPCIIAHAIHNSIGTLVLLLCVNTNLPGCPV